MDEEDDPLLINDDIPVMDRGHLDRPVGAGWDQGFYHSKEEIAREERLRSLRPGKKNRGMASW